MAGLLNAWFCSPVFICTYLLNANIAKNISIIMQKILVIDNQLKMIFKKATVEVIRRHVSVSWDL